MTAEKAKRRRRRGIVKRHGADAGGDVAGEEAQNTHTHAQW
jgi:hypothetical protein